MLHPKIVELSTDEATGETYMEVWFWESKAARARGDVPFLMEDFIMPLRVFALVPPPFDEDEPVGNLPDVEPDLAERGPPVIVLRDTPADIEAIIARYVERAEARGYRGDNTSGNANASQAFSVGGVEVRKDGGRVEAPRARNDSDPEAVLSRPEVAALRGKPIDLKGGPP